ncbi:MAG: drug efflux transport system permease protein [Clostridiales bacterium]|jgi:ABC-2 type transport system permease protein|nr:drug efflux transport system permease protein [Clostridiales bacterium]
MSVRRLWFIIKKEFIQIRRDRVSLGIAIGMPLMMLFLFGYAVKTEVDHISMAVFDMSRSQESRELIHAFQNSNYFVINYDVSSNDTIKKLIDTGKAKAGVIIPPDYGKKIIKGIPPQVQFIVDGSDPTVARTALSSGLLVGQSFSLDLKQKIVHKKSYGFYNSGGIDLRSSVWYNPSLKSELFTIPGLIGLIMQNITVMLTAFALVREKERGTIEQLIVTPIKRLELILGKLIPYIFIGFADFIGVLFLGTHIFHVPIKGSIGLLMLLGAGFVTCALAIGIFISTMAENQLQAMQGVVLFILPSVLLSGFMFPREAMPLVIQWLGYAVPLTYFLDIIRGIILKGLTFQDLTYPITVLAVLGASLLTLATLRFHKKLD